MPQLDALRALAVLSVMYSHWMHPWTGGLPFGPAGVQLFFVLSGFLITGILLHARDEAQTRGHVLKAFYARRFLRIFPLYYAVVIAGLVIGFPPTRHMIGWAITYTLNIKFFIDQDWPAYIGHFWSLAVEEQFYLIWPCVILFTPRRWLVGVILAMIAAVWALRFTFAAVAQDAGGSIWMDILPFMAFDALGAGALLACLGPHEAGGRRLAKGCGWVGVPALVIMLAVCCRFTHPLLGELRQAAMVAAYTWLIAGASVGFRGVAGRVLDNRVLISIGTVSYGVYVLHNLAFNPVRTLLRDVAHGEPALPIALLCAAAVTFGAAYASWFAFERPINRLKHHFPYRERPGQSLGDITQAPPEPVVADA